LIGQSTFEFIAEKDRVRTMETLKSVLEDGQIRRDVEITFLTEDGREYLAEVSSALLRDAAGNPAGFIAIFRDITERKQAEEALRESEEKYRVFFKTSRDAVFITSKDGRWIDFNDAIVELLGYENSDELRKVRMPEVYEKPEERERITQAIEKRGFAKDLAVNFRKKDGSIINILITAVVNKDENGNVIGYQGTFTDITERKRAEEALKFAYAELGQIFDATADAIRVIDKDFNILRINEASVTLSGVSKDEAVGKKCYDIFRCPRCHSPSCSLTQILNGEERIEIEEERGRGDGINLSCIVTVTPFRQPDGKVIGIVSSIKDITKRKRAEEHAQFLASVLESSSQPFAVGYSDGRLRTFNTAYCELLGYSRGELHELKWDTELTPPEWREVVAKAAEEIIRTRQPQRFEKEYIRKDGSLVPVEVFANPIFDSKGDLEYFFSFFTDITERRQAEEALRESEERYRHLFDNLNDAVFLADVETGMIIETNQQGATLLGRSHDEIVGMHQSELHPP
ncbi:MAG: PAS domain S-box protein, partial [Dehalococcoidia bacterium]|nr:PAS domain S-box protein [Dehalococcoidia bacterium]